MVVEWVQGERCVERTLCTWTDILQWQLSLQIHLRDISRLPN